MMEVVDDHEDLLSYKRRRPMPQVPSGQDEEEENSDWINRADVFGLIRRMEMAADALVAFADDLERKQKLEEDQKKAETAKPRQSSRKSRLAISQENVQSLKRPTNQQHQQAGAKSTGTSVTRNVERRTRPVRPPQQQQQQQQEESTRAGSSSNSRNEFSNTALTAANVQAFYRARNMIGQQRRPQSASEGRRRREQRVRVTPGMLIEDPSVSDDYLDALIQRHAPTLSQHTEQTRTYRPRFMSVSAWNASLSRDMNSADRSLMRSYLQQVMETPEEKSKGLSKTAIMSLSSYKCTTDYETPCCICLDNIVTGHQILMLPCSHGFHRACIEQWLEKSATCPLCKHVIE